MCCIVLQRVAVCCSVLQCVAVCCSVLQCVGGRRSIARSLCIAVCCGGLQCGAVCCSVLQWVGGWCSIARSLWVSVCCGVLQCVTMRCNVLLCAAMCCSVLLCVAMCCRDSEEHGAFAIETLFLYKLMHNRDITQALKRRDTSIICRWLKLTLSLTEGRRWDKHHTQRSTAGSWLCWLEYVIRTSMNTRIISSIITNRASDRYSEHSKWVS